MVPERRQTARVVKVVRRLKVGYGGAEIGAVAVLDSSDRQVSRKSELTLIHTLPITILIVCDGQSLL